MAKLTHALSLTIVNHIGTLPIGKHDYEDYPVWENTANGKFSTKSVYQKSITPGQHSDLIQKVWHNKIPFKISFLALRM